jgi:hypothetical protein
MAKKLSDIRVFVDSSGEDFGRYLRKVLDREVLTVINMLSRVTNLFIFSGVIRNFFLNNSEVRDIDIVMAENIEIQAILKKYRINRNSFGGYKILIGKTKMDLWSLHNTWAIKQGSKPIGFSLDQYIPYTAFFNFSAIVYSYSEKKFLYHKAFLSFLRDKEINYVHKPNANIALCIVNTFYYSDKYKLKIAPKLMRYVIEMHKSGNRDYVGIQKKHFGKILYSEADINNRVFNLTKELKDKKIKRKSIQKAKEDSLIPVWLLGTLLKAKN